ncbi:hypothetical protein BTVI_146412 [Pitangus sulphuratus]|nr:hypothetical protein BTVI_146412 [Pitangus sulphuratus]
MTDPSASSEMGGIDKKRTEGGHLGTFAFPIVHKGTESSAGDAQKPTVHNWYAYLKGVNKIIKEWFGMIPFPEMVQNINGSPFKLSQRFPPSLEKTLLCSILDNLYY